MSVSSPMRQLAAVGHKPHAIDRKKCGQPRLALYYADRRHFTHPGLHLWTGKRHVRILPLPRRSR